jgi:hypothetical protein
MFSIEKGTSLCDENRFDGGLYLLRPSSGVGIEAQPNDMIGYRSDDVSW